MSINNMRKLFIISFIIIIMFSIGYYSTKYDVLARYPYNDENHRNIIREKLNMEQINYIIEYSIEPTYFIEFIDSPRFNIYNSFYYNEINNIYFDIDSNDVVLLYELGKELYDVDSLFLLMNEYHYTTLLEWFYMDKSNLNLISNPSNVNTILDDNNTILTRKHPNLYRIESYLTNNVDIFLDTRIKNSINNMCSAINTKFESTTCGDIIINKGYVSYDQQALLYSQDNSEDKPGHSYYQLGLTFDIDIEHDSDIYQYIVNNASRFNFKLIEDESLVLRFKG